MIEGHQGGGESETVETSSGAPPRLVSLEGTFEQNPYPSLQLAWRVIDGDGAARTRTWNRRFWRPVLSQLGHCPRGDGSNEVGEVGVWSFGG